MSGKTILFSDLRQEERMNLGARWNAISLGVALLSFAAFGFFVYSGLALTPTKCGVVPCTLSSILRAATNNVGALTDYIYGITALLIGQVVLASVWLVRRSRKSQEGP